MLLALIGSVAIVAFVAIFLIAMNRLIARERQKIIRYPGGMEALQAENL